MFSIHNINSASFPVSGDVLAVLRNIERRDNGNVGTLNAYLCTNGVYDYESVIVRLTHAPVHLYDFNDIDIDSDEVIPLPLFWSPVDADTDETPLPLLYDWSREQFFIEDRYCVFGDIPNELIRISDKSPAIHDPMWRHAIADAAVAFTGKPDFYIDPVTCDQTDYSSVDTFGINVDNDLFGFAMYNNDTQLLTITYTNSPLFNDDIDVICDYSLTAEKGMVHIYGDVKNAAFEHLAMCSTAFSHKRQQERF